MAVVTWDSKLPLFRLTWACGLAKPAGAGEGLEPRCHLPRGLAARYSNKKCCLPARGPGSGAVSLAPSEQLAFLEGWLGSEQLHFCF